MAQIEICIDYSQLEQQTASVSQQALALSLNGSIPALGGTSDAMDKFTALFEDLKKAVIQYSELLNADAENTKSAIESMKNKENESAENIKNLPELPAYSASGTGDR